MKRGCRADRARMLPRLMVVLVVAVVPAVLSQWVVPAANAAGEDTLFTPLLPARLADTRADGMTIDGLFAGGGKLAAGEVLQLDVGGRGGVPADAKAAVLNVTIVAPEGAGFATVWPCGSPQPLASNLNYTAGVTVPNAVFAKLGVAGKVCVYTQASAHVVVDVNGTFPAGSSFTPLVPARLVDTRAGGTTIDGSFAGGGKLAIGGIVELTVAGRGGVPADAEAVALNLTATDPDAAGHVTVWPCGAPQPNASSLNYLAGQTVANAVLVKVGGAGKVCFYSQAATHLVVDSNGAFPAGSSFLPLQPSRLADSRVGGVTVDGLFAGIGKIAPGGTLELTVAGRDGVPTDALAIALNVTVTEPDGAGFITVWPCGSPRPNASNLNYAVGQTGPNAVLAKIGIGGKVCFYSQSATHLIVDSNGAFSVATAAPVVSSIAPTTGPEAGGTTVTITGSNFTGATLVSFGPKAATSFTVDSSTQITAVAPAGTGIVDVNVTTIGGPSAAVATARFTYVPAPTVASIAPTTGPETGGTSVTITGSNFTGATAVRFGASSAASFTVDSATQITAVAPSGIGAVDVTVITIGGTSAIAAAGEFTYVPAPGVASIAPTAGPETGGTSVTITGTNFTGATAVRFGASPATSFTVDSATQITAEAPSGTGPVDVTVSTVGGPSAIVASGEFTYVPAPLVSSISPTFGPESGGTVVTITGADFTGATAVTFGVTGAAFTVDSATQITASAPAGAGTVDVTVTTAGGTSSTSAADQFTYVPAPVVTSIAPVNGPQSGGTVVTITGTEFTGATAVAFGATPATSFTVNSATQITAVAPSGTGTLDITVTTIGGTSAITAAGQFTYVQTPSVTSLSPTSGPAAGGTIVTITGTNFTGATAVSFGATPATSFTVNSATQITAVAPAGTGAVDVTVTTIGGTSAITSADQFTYVQTPSVTSISPTSGPAAGGTIVTITGTNLTGATAVTFGATAATSFTVNSSTQITATSPAGLGIVNVNVTTPGGTSATGPANQFMYVPAPTVTSLSPTSGPTAGGTIVTITGTNFTGATAVTFGATAATSFTVNSTTQITATSPAGTGTVNVTVTTPGGTSATGPADQFTYIPAPTVTSVSPTAGPTAGGTSVTITGTNFTGATAVTFGATAATSFIVISATQITATSPVGTGTVNVRVTTDGGTSATGAANQFTYIPAPTITLLSPTAGPLAGGTSVTISGTNFTGATAVAFGATPATTFTVDSATQITAVSPAGVGTVEVRVTTTGGTSAVVVADQFTYLPAPTTISATPFQGPTAGGTVVVLTGTNFLGATAVRFGTTAATTFTVDSATQITVTSPAHGPGDVFINVTTPGGTSPDFAGFIYYSPPTITSITPASGPVGGGPVNGVEIKGANLDSTSQVTFDGIPAAFVLILTAPDFDTFSILVTPPAHAAGPVDVVVTTGGGTATAVNGYTYVA